MKILQSIIKNPNDAGYNPAWHFNPKELPSFIISFIVLSILYLWIETLPTITENCSFALLVTYLMTQLEDIAATLKPSRRERTFFYIKRATGIILIYAALQTITNLHPVLCLVIVTVGVLFYYDKKIQKIAKEKEVSSDNS